MKDPHAKLTAIVERLEKRVNTLIQEQSETRVLVEQIVENLEQKPTRTMRSE